MPIALLLPLLPILVETVMKIVQGIKDSGQITPEQRVKFTELAARLDETNRAVQALEIRQV